MPLRSRNVYELLDALKADVTVTPSAVPVPDESTAQSTIVPAITLADDRLATSRRAAETAALRGSDRSERRQAEKAGAERAA